MLVYRLREAAAVFVEMWKRQQTRLAYEWGQDNFEAHELIRPSFQADTKRISPVDGRVEKIEPFWSRFQRSFLSNSVILTLITVVLGSVLGIFVLNTVLSSWNDRYGSVITALINAFQIQLMNFVYDLIW